MHTDTVSRDGFDSGNNTRQSRSVRQTNVYCGHMIVDTVCIHQRVMDTPPTQQVNIVFITTGSINKLIVQFLGLPELHLRLRTVQRWAGCQTWTGQTAAL